MRSIPIAGFFLALAALCASGCFGPPADLKIDELQVGAGKVAQSGDWVVVHYKGMLADGKVFENSVDSEKPHHFQLGQGKVIRGWDYGIVGMKVGGKRKLTIPPHLAYGEKGTPDGTIPANATLVFEVELMEVK